MLAFRIERHKADFGLAAYHVDPEYDRMLFDSVKKIFREGKSQDIRADLVVHIPGDADNLIALEMKKLDRSARGRQRRENDRQRLMAMTTPSETGGHTEWVSGYVLGLFIELDPFYRSYLVEEFRGGESQGESTGAF